MKVDSLHSLENLIKISTLVLTSLAPTSVALVVQRLAPALVIGSVSREKADDEGI